MSHDQGSAALQPVSQFEGDLQEPLSYTSPSHPWSFKRCEGGLKHFLGLFYFKPKLFFLLLHWTCRKGRQLLPSPSCMKAGEPEWKLSQLCWFAPPDVINFSVTWVIRFSLTKQSTKEGSDLGPSLSSWDFALLLCLMRLAPTDLYRLLGKIKQRSEIWILKKKIKKSNALQRKAQFPTQALPALRNKHVSMLPSLFSGCL